MIIDENQLSSAHNISNKPNSKQETKQLPHNNRPKRLLLYASSYLSIGHYRITVYFKIFPFLSVLRNVFCKKKTMYTFFAIYLCLHHFSLFDYVWKYKV